MAIFERWVDPVAGNNSNAGTQAAPWQTLFFAIDTDRTLTSADTRIINVVPSGTLTEATPARLLPQNNGCTFLVRSATPGTNYNVSATGAEFVQIFSNPTSKIRFEDATVSCNRVLFFSGSTFTNMAFQVEFAGNCIFTHARSNAEEAIRTFISPSTINQSRIKIEPGCRINGWSSIFFCQQNSIGYVDCDGLIVNGTSSFAGQTLLSGLQISIKNSSITIPTSGVANRIDINAQTVTGGVTLENNTITINTTSPFPVAIYCPLTGGSATVDVVVRDNTITANGGSYSLFLGKEILTASTRAANKATCVNFRSLIVEGNDITQGANGIGVLGVMVGADGAVVEDNYLRVNTLGNTSNVHQIYFHADTVTFRNNFCQASILLFGEDQIVNGNVGVAYRPILLGGTGGGSTAVKGGNRYTILDNILISFNNNTADGDVCYGDYAWLNAYPTNIGILEAEIDRNKYVTLAGVDGLARLTNQVTGLADTVALTMTELRNMWQQSVRTGTGSGVWGVASNATNDGASKHVTSGKSFDLITSLCVSGAALTRMELTQIKKSFNPPGSDQIVDSVFQSVFKPVFSKVME